MRVCASVMVAFLLGGGGAWAQGNPSADQIINSLRPTGGSLSGGTRGIRPVSPTAPAPSEPTPAAAGSGVSRAARPAPAPRAASTGEAAAPSVNLTVDFASGSAELTPAAVSTLTVLGRALSSNTLSGYRFRIEGHTDTVGSVEANKALSERRAQAVVTFLASRFNLDTARLDAVGMGADGLLVQTPPNTAEPRNRRVQIINLGT